MAHSHEYVLDRRTINRDSVTTFIKTISGINVGIVVIAMYLVFQAQPISFAQMDANLGIRTTWDHQSLTYLLGLMICGFITGVGGLIGNSKRLKRRYDHLRKNFFLMAGGSLAGIIVFLLYQVG